MHLQRRLLAKIFLAQSISAGVPIGVNAALPGMRSRFLPAMKKWLMPYPIFDGGSWKQAEPAFDWPSQSGRIDSNSGVAVAFMDGVSSATELPFLVVTAGYAPLFDRYLIPPRRRTEFMDGRHYFSLHIKGGVKNLAWVNAMTGRPLSRYAIDMVHGLVDEPRNGADKLSCSYDHRQARLMVGAKECISMNRIWNGLEDPVQYLALHRNGEWGSDRPYSPTKVSKGSIDVIIGFDFELEKSSEFILRLGKIQFFGCDVVVPEIVFGYFDETSKQWLG